MDVKKLNELRQLAIQKMDAGDFKDALKLAYKIKSLGSHYLVSYTVSGLLIDIGSPNALQNEEIVKEGVELLRKDFEMIVHDQRYAPTAYYNLANGYYVIFNFKNMRDPYFACFRETELDQAKTHYRKELNMISKMPFLCHRFW